jgi:cysteine desulfuration protein SufE
MIEARPALGWRLRDATESTTKAGQRSHVQSSEALVEKMAAEMPKKLQELLETFDMFPDPADRTQLLLSYADQFREVPKEIATRPFPKDHQVPQCESDAYVWAMKQPDGTLNLYFAVENPSGVSARALAAILDRTLSGLPASDIANVSCDIVERIFRRNISMGKGMGLMAMVQAVQTLAKNASKP